MGIQVPEPCGHCATVIARDGLCKPDGGSLIALVVVNCHGDETVTQIIDPSTGFPYAGPVVECSSFAICSDVEFRDGLCQPDGSPLVAVVVTSCDGTEITVNVLDPETGLPYAGPIIECNALTVVDTESIDLTLVDNVLSADLLLDPASEAPVSITPDGLRVDCCPDDGGWVTQVKTGNQLILDNIGVDLVDLPGFTPVPNAIYEIEAKLLVSSSVANNGTRGRIQFPVGLAALGWTARSVDGSAGLEAISYGGPSVLSGSSNVPIVNQPYLMDMRGMIDTGPAPAVGNLRPQVATENLGVAVTAWRGSMFKWRRVL